MLIRCSILSKRGEELRSMWKTNIRRSRNPAKAAHIPTHLGAALLKIISDRSYESWGLYPERPHRSNESWRLYPSHQNPGHQTRGGGPSGVRHQGPSGASTSAMLLAAPSNNPGQADGLRPEYLNYFFFYLINDGLRPESLRSSTRIYLINYGLRPEYFL